MSSDLAELSSIATSLGDLTERVVVIAERRQAADAEDRLPDQLFEVERILRQALGRLERLR